MWAAVWEKESLCSDFCNVFLCTIACCFIKKGRNQFLQEDFNAFRILLPMDDGKFYFFQCMYVRSINPGVILLAWLHCHDLFFCPCFQLLDVDPNDQEEDGANIDLDSQRKGKCAVIKTSTRQVRRTCPARSEEWCKGSSPGTSGFAQFDFFFTDIFPACYWVGWCWEVEAWRFGGEWFYWDS